LKQTIQQTQSLERFIPVALDELINELMLFEGLDKNFKQQFQLFCDKYIALYHAQLKQQNELVEHYLPFSPDRDTISKFQPSPEQYLFHEEKLFLGVDSILQKANFESLTKEQLNKALNKTSPYGVEVSVNFDAFEAIKIYYRGASVKKEWQRNWKTLFFKKEPIEVPIYRRLFLLLKPKNQETLITELQAKSNLDYQKAKKQIEKKINLMPDVLDGHTIFIKLFKDIPQSDLEMIFPNTRIRMRLLDKLRLSITGGGGTIGGIIATAGKLASALDPMTIILAISGFVGVLWRQISNIFSQRTKYMAALNQHLYYYNMDNNRGALAHIVDLAEVEECKETILCYFFLARFGAMESDELDQRIENYIRDKYSVAMDFEVSDGIRKLTELGLLETQQKLKLLPWHESLSLLEKHWQQSFP